MSLYQWCVVLFPVRAALEPHELRAAGLRYPRVTRCGQRPYTGRTDPACAGAGVVRDGSIPIPLLLGAMSRGRAASVFHKRKGSRRKGGTGIWGEPRTPPSTPSGPVPRSPPDPLLTSPRTTHTTAPMTE